MGEEDGGKGEGEEQRGGKGEASEERGGKGEKKGGAAGAGPFSYYYSLSSTLLSRQWPWWKVTGGTAGFSAYAKRETWKLERLKQPFIIALAFAIVAVMVAVTPIAEYLDSGDDAKVIGWMLITVSVVSSRSHVLSLSVVFRRSVGSSVGVAYALGEPSYYLSL